MNAPMLKPRGRHQPSPTQDRFAELLSEGLSSPEASRAMGIDPVKGRKILAAIRKRLGAQAI